MIENKDTIIKKVTAREILDSRGVPTVEAEVFLEGGVKAWAQIPSGSSTGALEAVELRDRDEKRYFGKGVLKAVKNVNNDIASIVVGLDALNQRKLDEKMIKADGTENKGKFGANAILAVSLAVCRAAAISQDLPLYKYIAKLHGTKNFVIPIPMFNIINGGKHSDSGLAIQEYKIVPEGIKTFKEQYRAGSEIFHALKTLLKDSGKTVAVGDEGGFAPKLDNNTSPLTEISKAVNDAGYKIGEEVGIALDCAANSFYDEETKKYVFEIEEKVFSTEELIEVYRDWIENNNIISIEDGVTEDDWEGWSKMHTELGDKIMMIGDDLLVTNVKLLQKAIDNKSCNAVLIKPNQIGTLTETLACMKLAQENNFKTVVSHRSGETVDDFIADLSVGAAANYIKTGSLSRGERLVKYNRLLNIEEQLNNR